jgi:hypothetical protein
MSRTRPEGIEVRHTRSCPAAAKDGGTCRCQPSFRTFVFDRRSGKKIRTRLMRARRSHPLRGDAEQLQPVVAVQHGHRRGAHADVVLERHNTQPTLLRSVPCLLSFDAHASISPDSRSETPAKLADGAEGQLTWPASTSAWFVVERGPTAMSGA